MFGERRKQVVVWQIFSGRSNTSKSQEVTRTEELRVDEGNQENTQSDATMQKDLPLLRVAGEWWSQWKGGCSGRPMNKINKGGGNVFQDSIIYQFPGFRILSIDRKVQGTNVTI